MRISKLQATVLLLLITVLFGCAGLNPNVGERTADIAWHHNDYSKAIEIIQPRAEAGYPWAQLRLGIMYELGVGIEKNIPESVKWYKKASVQKAEGDWAEGLLVGATGEDGYFNQNSDARLAQFQLANIYLKGEGIEKDLIEAYLNIRTVKEESKGHDIFYCCEFAGGRYITAKQIAETYEKIIKEMSPEDLKKAEEQFQSWKSKAE